LELDGWMRTVGHNVWNVIYFKTGNIEEFEYKLHKENGALVEYLRETARQTLKPTRDELKELIVEYRAKLNLVKKKFMKNNN